MLGAGPRRLILLSGKRGGYGEEVPSGVRRAIPLRALLRCQSGGLAARRSLSSAALRRASASRWICSAPARPARPRSPLLPPTVAFGFRGRQPGGCRRGSGRPWVKGRPARKAKATATAKAKARRLRFLFMVSRGVKGASRGCATRLRLAL